MWDWSPGAPIDASDPDELAAMIEDVDTAIESLEDYRAELAAELDEARRAARYTFRFPKADHTDREEWQDAMHDVYATLQARGEASTDDLYRAWPTTGIGGGRISRERWERQVLPALVDAPGVVARLWRVDRAAALDDEELATAIEALDVEFHRIGSHIEGDQSRDVNLDRLTGAYRALREHGALTGRTLQHMADDAANVRVRANDRNWRECVLPALAALPGVMRPAEDLAAWEYRDPDAVAESGNESDLPPAESKYDTGMDDGEPAHGATL